MVTAESVKNKMQGLIQKANQTTGKTDTDMTAAIGSLIAGFGQGGGGGLAYDMGEFVFDTHTVPSTTVSIPHNLGAAPEFVCVWTDHWAGLTSENPVSYEDNLPAAVGFIWLKNITGMIYAATGSASGSPLCLSLRIARGDYRVGAVLPNSVSYGIPASAYHQITDKVFCLPNFGTSHAKYRAGVTYKYFVSRAWWNVGGVASAE